MTNAASQTEQPWAPICNIQGPTDSIAIPGILYVWAEDRTLYANAGRALVRLGDTRIPIWNHSLLNPFRLMTWMPQLQTTYPTLTDAHYAVLMSSQAPVTPEQRQLLQEIMTLAAIKIPDGHTKPGFTLAHQLYQQAVKTNQEPVESTHSLLWELLAYLLYREDLQVEDHVDEASLTLPDIAISPVEIAQLYQTLVLPMTRDLIRQCPDELTDVLGCWDRIAGIMRQYPELISHPDRLATSLVQSTQSSTPPIPLIATDDQQLVCIGLGPNDYFADGLGVYLRLAPESASNGVFSNQETLAIILAELLTQLGLTTIAGSITSKIASIAKPAVQFHFNVADSLNQV